MPQTNGLAIAAIILAFLFPPAGLVLGIMAKNQIELSGEDGEGLATAAIVISCIAIAIYIIVFIAVIAAVHRVNNGFPNGSTLVLLRSHLGALVHP